LRPSEMILVNGIVRTMAGDGAVAEAVAVRDGTVAAVGSDHAILGHRGPGTEVVDLRGRLLLPGFCDAHAHASAAVAEVFSAQLHHLPSVEACLDAVRAWSAAHPELPLVTGEGWNNTIAPGRGPCREDLDAVVADRPVVLTSEDYHSLWCNSRALEMAGVTTDTADPPGGVIERLPTGEPAGTLRETAMELVNAIVPDYSEEQYREGILHYQRKVAGPAGITLVFDPLLPRPESTLGECRPLRAYEGLAADGGLSLRVRLGLTLTPEDDLGEWIAAAVAERDALKHVGEAGRNPAVPVPSVAVTAVKLFEDGVVEGHTAYLLDDYADAPGDRGEPLWSLPRLKEACAAADAAGLQLHVHAIGDAATAETLDALEHVRAVNGERDRRAAITHVQLVASDDIARFAELGVVAAAQPFWYVHGVDYRELEVPYLGAERAAAEYPFRSFIEAGAAVAGASDFPVTKPCDPLIGIQAGIMRWLPDASDGDAVLGPDERGTVDQLVAAFTAGGAYAHRLERTTGSIEVGKSADLVVVDRDLYTIEPAAIGSARVLMTLFEGRPVFTHPEL